MTPTFKSLASTVAFAVTSLLALASSAAQPGGPPPPPLPERVGLEGGVGLDGGAIHCEDDVADRCEGVTEAAGIAGHLTYMFGPRLGITFDVWPMVHREDDFTFTHTVVTLGATVRPIPILGLTVGLGGANAVARWENVLGAIDVEDRNEAGGAILFAADLDIVRGRNFAVALGARAGIGFYGNDADDDGDPDIVGRNLGLGASITWF
jgi:hypothetical protein